MELKEIKIKGVHYCHEELIELKKTITSLEKTMDKIINVDDIEDFIDIMYDNNICPRELGLENYCEINICTKCWEKALGLSEKKS